jgi:6-phosphogluconolactonase
MMVISPNGRGTGKPFLNVGVQMHADLDELSRAAASELLRQARRAVQAKGLFSLALSGGSTPKSLYALLAEDSSFRAEVPWDKTHFFWGDERHVPPEHPESNYRMAQEALLSKVPLPSENIHRINAGNPNAQRAAEEYEETLRAFFRLRAGEFPRFDLVLLGMGPDGHTASLFPGTEALRERKRMVVANWVEKLHAHRITMTLPVFNRAAMVLFLVSGEEKAETLRRVLGDRRGKDPFPSQLIHPIHGKLLWLVDRGAGHFLGKTPKIIISNRSPQP